jgi:hypothetical protein
VEFTRNTRLAASRQNRVQKKGARYGTILKSRGSPFHRTVLYQTDGTVMSKWPDGKVWKKLFHQPTTYSIFPSFTVSQKTIFCYTRFPNFDIIL